MTEPIEFAKLCGSGNDFVCIDNRDGRFDKIVSHPDRVGRLVRSLCHRRLAIGADGVMFACRPELDGVSDIGARFFEPDGSEAELCGNGAACFLRWVVANGWIADREVKVLTPAGVIRGRHADGSYVRVCIPLPEDLQSDLVLAAEDASLTCDFAVTGVPHVITYVEDLDKTDVLRYGPALRNHEQFQPRGANANFVQVLSEGEIAIRTFEFGVERETLSCGTGSAAAVVLCLRRFGWSERFRSGEHPVLVRARSGDVLKVYVMQRDDGTYDDLCLETIVRFSYYGRIHPDLAERALAPAARRETCNCALSDVQCSA